MNEYLIREALDAGWTVGASNPRAVARLIVRLLDADLKPEAALVAGHLRFLLGEGLGPEAREAEAVEARLEEARDPCGIGAKCLVCGEPRQDDYPRCDACEEEVDRSIARDVESWAEIQRTT